MVIAIDGPAGVGKTTVAKLLAKELGITYIDTGAMYRAITYKALLQGINLRDDEAISRLAETTEILLDGERIWVDGVEVTEKIRSADIEKNVSKVAANPGVRKWLVALQRKIVHGLKWAVVEGRDIGSVVFPDAEWKFYLDASLELRAKRRYNELMEKGKKVKFEDVKEEIRTRDSLDMGRKESPLIRDKEAIYIDTTSMGIDEVISRIKGFIGDATDKRIY